MSEVPSGFVRVSVLLTVREAQRLRPALQPHGTHSEAIRKAMGLHTTPYGLVGALKRHKTTNED